MDIDELPIGERLDALLRQFDEDSHNVEGELDYAQFVERRAHEHDLQQLPSDGEPDDTAMGDSEAAFDSDAENQWFHESDAERPLSPLSSPRAAQSQSIGKDIPKKPKKLKNKSKGQPGYRTRKNADTNAPRPVDKYVADAYTEAGLDMALPNTSQGEKVHAPRRSARQTQREIEEAARQNQRLERMLVDEIGCHTTKTVTVDDFLADFDATQISPPSSPAKSTTAHKRFSELVSSPPRMQGLRSFVAHGDSHRKDAPLSPAASQGDSADSDSDLEIIPETRAARMSQPIRELLRFGGGTAAERQLAANRAKLQQMQRDQIINRSRGRVEKLKAQGFDVDSLTNAMNEQKQASAQGAAAWLARERAEADAILAAERSDEGERASEAESDAMSSDFDVEVDQQDGDHSTKSYSRRQGRKFVLSDSEEENELADHSPAERTGKGESQPGLETLLEASGYAPATPSPLAAEAETDEDEGEKYTEGTQYVAPLSPRARAALFGSQSGALDVDAPEDSSNERLSSVTSQSPVMGLERETEELSDLEIEVGRDADKPHRVEPDLADLRDADLSLSQRMAEVRQRYLRAEHEQRRQLIESKSTKPRGSAPVRSAFVEDQAEESDDEDGSGGIRRRDGAFEPDDEDNDDDGAGNADLAELVDHTAVDVRAAKLKQKFIEDERAQDERLLNDLVDGVNGGFRRKKTRNADGVFLNDDDIEFGMSEEVRAYRQMLEQKRQSKLLGSSSRVARLAASERNHAFFQSITSELIARPPNAERSSTVQDGLQFLRSVADSGRRQAQLPEVVAGNEQASSTSLNAQDHEAPTTGLSTALRLTSLRNPKQLRRPSRQPTIQDPLDKGLSGRRTTYASRISASEAPTVKTMEILQSLGPKQNQRPKKNLVAPSEAPQLKRRRMVSTTAHASGAALFRRSWN